VPWGYSLSERALKQLGKLDRQTQRDIFAYCDERIAGTGDPRRFGKALTGPYRGLWRYRLGDYRLICQIKDRELIVLVLAVGHRREVYR
jgi:mRNA interferase RelE/StbE